MNIEEILARDFGTLPALIALHASLLPPRIALRQDERALDYKSLGGMMDRIACSLQRDGVGPGDSVAICAAMSIEYAAVFLGILRAGAAVAPLAPSSTAASLAAMVADAGARHLFLDQAVGAALEPVASRLPARRIALDGSPAGQALEAWLVEPGRRPQPVDAKPDDAFNIIYSSGTTGTPKGIVQSNRMRWSQWQRAAAYDYRPDSVTLVSTPLYSNTTLVSFLPTLAMGGVAVLMPKFDAKGFLDLAQKHRATTAMLVPVQYARIMALPAFGDYDLSSFRAKFCTSAPFAAALKTDILRRWPGKLVEYYGMTEGGGTCVLEAHLHPSKVHTVGKPAPGHDIRLIDEQGRVLPPGATGEIVGHSEGIMTGYHNQPAKTAEAEWRDEQGKRFIRTGDIGRFDEDGFLVLMDRKKDMIISGGFNVYPSDLEAVLRAHEDVAEAAVVGVPSERWGETPVAFVVARRRREGLEKEIQEWANAQLGKTQRIAAVELVESLPRSAIGKVLKRELRGGWQARAASNA
ncbi:MAG TPA: class I adenylate-forming enzyme family protein [Burkholderiales bacterium]|nr:class I adenylate-forming enzyme family protein [Burkholderiales bacterium]